MDAAARSCKCAEVRYDCACQSSGLGCGCYGTRPRSFWGTDTYRHFAHLHPHDEGQLNVHVTDPDD